MIESAGELLASARYWSARGIAEANPDHARLAATLVAGSRQAERDAWAIAALEAAARAEHDGDDLRAQQREFQRRLAERTQESTP
jgi:hypothetical protein